MEQTNNFESHPKTAKWYWLLILLVVASGVGIYSFRILRNSSEDSNAGSVTSTKSSTSEVWQTDGRIFLADTTSTDTHKLSDGTYRIYYMSEGQMVYADSSDGLTFTTAISTGITEDAGKFMSNPAVMKVAENDWIMIYEQSPQRQPGAPANSQPGPSNQRNLYLATSVDGKAFSKIGLAIDSAVDDRYFASVPDLVMTPDGKIRMYYVSQGDSIGSALSSDNGRTWVRDSGLRLTDMAVDPDVLIQTKNGLTSYVMYYTILDPSRNALYKATSSDGLTWTESGKILSKTSTASAIVDADVFALSDTSYVMYFGQSLTGNSTGAGETMNLYRATLTGSVFK